MLPFNEEGLTNCSGITSIFIHQIIIDYSPLVTFALPMKTVPLFRRAPFIRILIPFVTGIISQWYLHLSLPFLMSGIFIALVVIVSYSSLPVPYLHRFKVINGLFINILICFFAMALVHKRDIHNDQLWFGRSYEPDDEIEVTIKEAPVEKEQSIKAIASVDYILQKNMIRPAKGTVILYIRKDSLMQPIKSGSVLLVHGTMQLIRNQGNPGEFDYAEYCLLQGITHQMFLNRNEYAIINDKHTSLADMISGELNSKMVSALRKYISPSIERSVAESFLTGNKNDLDNELARSYSNTGAIRIINISGMRLAFIFGILLFLTRPLGRIRRGKIIRFLLIITGIWITALIYDKHISMCRTAILFSLLAAGDLLERRTNIYNNLAVCIFILLCFDPFWLWDIGFQVSIAALLSLKIFFTPIYKWVRFHNKIVDYIWKIFTGCLSVQVLTIPVTLYYFHQLSLLSLLSNLIVVPVSALLVILEVVLCLFSFSTYPAMWIAHVIVYMIQGMDHYIENLDLLPFGLYNDIYMSGITLIFSLLVILFISYWLMRKKIPSLWTGLISLLLLCFMRTVSIAKFHMQDKIIVYNIPRHEAIDLLSGNSFSFIGDSDLHRLYPRQYSILRSSRAYFYANDEAQHRFSNAFSFDSKKVIILNTSAFIDTIFNDSIELMIVSGKIKLPPSALNALRIRQIVLDSSVPSWKADIWKQQCDSLHIPCYDVSKEGAFVMDLKK